MSYPECEWADECEASCPQDQLLYSGYQKSDKKKPACFVSNSKIFGPKCKCIHPSFAIIYNIMSHDENREYELKCYECGKSLPFFFYTGGEFERILAKRKREVRKKKVAK